MGDIGFGEVVLILLAAIMIWGGRLPEVLRKVGFWYARLRNTMLQVRDELMRHVPEQGPIFPEENPVPAPPDPSPPPPAASDPPPTDNRSPESARAKKKKPRRSRSHKPAKNA